MEYMDKSELSEILNSLIIGVSIIAVGVRLFIPRAIVTSGRKASIFFGVVLITIALINLGLPGGLSGFSYTFFIFFAILILGAFLSFRNWVLVSNVDYALLREKVRDILGRKNIPFTETRNTLKLADSSSAVEFVHRPLSSSTSIRMQGRLPASFLADLQLELKNTRTPKIDWSALYFISTGLFLATIQLSDYLPDNGIGMSSIPYGRPLTFGEVLLEKTFLLVPGGFILWAVMGAILGVRLLFRRPLLLSSWWFAIPGALPSFGFAFRAALSQIVYGFDFSDTMFALFMVSLLLPIARYGWGHIALDIEEKDFVECLKSTLDKRNLTYSVSDSLFTLGSEKSYVVLTPAEGATALVHLEAKTFTNPKEFISDLRASLNKKVLTGFPKMGMTILLISLAFLMLWLLPVGIGLIARVFGL